MDALATGDVRRKNENRAFRLVVGDDAVSLEVTQDFRPRCLLIHLLLGCRFLLLP
jgi:hypothetical protein